MPKLSKYRAAGQSAGRYKSILSDVASTEYAKEHEEWKVGRTKSMIGQVGASVANILGIIDERKKASEFAKYKDIAADLPGVVAEEQEYKTALGRTKTKTVYKSAISGRVIPESALSAMGFQESFSPGTSGFADYQKVLEEGTIYSPTAAKMATEATYEAAGVSSQEEYEELMGTREFEEEELPFTEADSLEMEPEIEAELPEKDIEEQEFESIIPEVVSAKSIDWESIEKDRLFNVQQEKERYAGIKEDADMPGGVSIDVAIQQKAKAAMREVKPTLDIIGRLKTDDDLAEYLLSDNEHIKFAAEKRQRELKSIAVGLEETKAGPDEQLEIRREDDIFKSLTKEEEGLFKADLASEFEYEYVEGNKQREGSKEWFDAQVRLFKRRKGDPFFSSESGKSEYNKQLEVLAKESGWTGSSWE